MALSTLYIYPSYVEKFLGTTTTYYPLRFRFQLAASDATSLASTDQIKITFTSSAVTVNAANTVNCYFKKFLFPALKYTSAYEIYQPGTPCTLAATQLTVPLPSAGLNKNGLYELVVTSTVTAYPNAYSSSNIGITAITSKVKFTTIFWDGTTSTRFGSVNEYWPYQGTNFNAAFRLSEFYITSKAVSTKSTIYMKFTTSTGTYNNFPRSYIEIEFPTRFSLFPNQLTTDTAGSELPCYVNGLSAISALYQSPRCILIHGDSTLYYSPSVIRVENFNTFGATTISLSIEEITLPASTSPRPDIRVILYRYSSSVWYKLFMNINDAFTPVTAGSPSTLTSNLSPVSNVYWTSTTASISTTASNWLPSVGANDYIVVKIPSAVGANVNFASLSFSLTGGTPTVLYRNTKNYYICK